MSSMRDFEAMRNAARVLEVLGSHHIGAELPCGQHYSIGCALACKAMGPCGWDVLPCNGPDLLRELQPINEGNLLRMRWNRR